MSLCVVICLVGQQKGQVPWTCIGSKVLPSMCLCVLGMRSSNFNERWVVFISWYSFQFHLEDIAAPSASALSLSLSPHLSPSLPLSLSLSLSYSHFHSLTLLPSVTCSYKRCFPVSVPSFFDIELCSYTFLKPRTFVFVWPVKHVHVKSNEQMLKLMQCTPSSPKSPSQRVC